LWYFLRKLKDEQRLLNVSSAAARRGEAPLPKRRKWRELERRIERLKAEYNNGDRDLLNYWNAVTHAIKTYV